MFRLLDAVDMGVVAVDPDDLRRCKAKANNANNRYMTRHKNMREADFEGKSKANLARQHGWTTEIGLRACATPLLSLAERSG